MASRSNNTDNRSQSHGPLGQDLRLPSPRSRPAAEVPPELSPLDAFAAHSRLLAQQLGQRANDGKRMSRLPPLVIESSLRQGRPGFFRSLSAQGSLVSLAKVPYSTGPALKTELEAQSVRPTSIHPRMSNIPPQLMSDREPYQLHFQDEEEGPQQRRGRRSPDPETEFGSRREQSPAVIGSEVVRRQEDISASEFAPQPSLEFLQQRDQWPWRQPGSREHDSRLAPPRSPFALGTSSIRSVSLDDSDEDFSVSMVGSFPSQHRTFSSSSAGLSLSPISPPSLSAALPPRSPSPHSDISVTGPGAVSRPLFNFSRPLSRSASDLYSGQPERKLSSDSQPFLLSDENTSITARTQSEDLPGNSDGSAAPSYVYSRFSLPRGKMLHRNSKMVQDNLPQAEFQWEQPVAPYSNIQAYHHSELGLTPPSPPSRRSTSSLEQTSINVPLDNSNRSSHDQSRRNKGDAKSQSHSTKLASEITGLPMRIDYSTRPAASNTSGGPVKARSQYPRAPSAEGTAEEHVTKGIHLHEQGSLNESTYHLRIAARQNHPTGMLLYALACRHGWGMRPNQHEGVRWLRKAADYAILEIADDESQVRVGKSVDIVDQRTRKARFALSIYELGVSHMNGWGIEQDKVLALRCFEIAGAWGDGDALAEAGFCYAQGVGCKKDLKKSAAFYRLAESSGVSMVGNSWIHKTKYKEDEDGVQEPTQSPEKKSRSKSRTRSIFWRHGSRPST